VHDRGHPFSFRPRGIGFLGMGPITIAGDFLRRSRTRAVGLRTLVDRTIGIRRNKERTLASIAISTRQGPGRRKTTARATVQGDGPNRCSSGGRGGRDHDDLSIIWTRQRNDSQRETFLLHATFVSGLITGGAIASGSPGASQRLYPGADRAASSSRRISSLKEWRKSLSRDSK